MLFYGLARPNLRGSMRCIILSRYFFISSTGFTQVMNCPCKSLFDFIALNRDFIWFRWLYVIFAGIPLLYGTPFYCPWFFASSHY